MKLGIENMRNYIEIVSFKEINLMEYIRLIIVIFNDYDIELIILC